MYEFVSIPAIMFIVMVGFIIFLIAFNFFLFYKWGKSLEELDECTCKKFKIVWSVDDEEWKVFNKDEWEEIVSDAKSKEKARKKEKKDAKNSTKRNS